MKFSEDPRARSRVPRLIRSEVNTQAIRSCANIQIAAMIGFLYFAFLGLAAVLHHLEETLSNLGVRNGEHDENISRVGCCADILASNFSLNPKKFVMHSCSNRLEHVTRLDKSINGKSECNTSVTIGVPRNRQVVI